MDRSGGLRGITAIVGRVKLTGRRVLLVAGAAALFVVAGAAIALAVGAPPAPESHTSTLPADGRSSATLEVVTGTRELDVKVGNLGGTLLEATTPAGTPAPDLRLASGEVRLSARSGASAVTVTLNENVSWQLDFGGGTERTVADLRGGNVSAVSFAAGSDIIDLTLPRPRAMVPVRLAGGASQFLVSLPGGVPVRVTAAAGAGEVSVDGATYTGVGGGAVFATRGWAARSAGFDVDATAGAAVLSVARWS
jgi:hypothetical protein